MFKKEINIITGNHHSIDGISDHIEIFKDIFVNSGWKVEIKKFPVQSKINLIFDEFTHPLFNQKLQNKLPNTKFILVLTEFINKRKNIFTFNNFKLNIFQLSCLQILTFLHTLCFKSNFKFLFKILNFCITFLYIFFFSINDYCRKNFFFIFKISRSIKKVFPTFNFRFFSAKRYQYDHIRFLSFTNNIKYFDCIFSLHPKIESQYRLYAKNNKLDQIKVINFLPVIDSTNWLRNFTKKKYGFIFSGTMSTYRQEKIKNFEKILKKSNKNLDINLKLLGFKSKKEMRKNDFAFSYHPQLFNEWPYSSPVRVYRSLCVDFTIPVLSKRFNDHPIENLTLLEGKDDLSESYFNSNSSVVMLKKILKYNKLSDKLNFSSVKNFENDI